MGIDSHAGAAMRNDRRLFSGAKVKGYRPLGSASAEARSVRVREALFVSTPGPARKLRPASCGFGEGVVY